MVQRIPSRQDQYSEELRLASNQDAKLSVFRSEGPMSALEKIGTRSGLPLLAESSRDQIMGSESGQFMFTHTSVWAFFISSLN
jgi:hypothetical protein